MKKEIGLIACAGMLAAMSALAQAPAAGREKPGTPPPRQHERKPGMGPGGAGLMHNPGQDLLGLFHQLNLTPEQKEKIKQIFEQKKEQNKSVRESVQTLRQQLMEQMGSDNPDPEKIRALHRQIAEVEGNLAASRAEGLKEIKALLTPEQAAQLTKKMADGRARMEQLRKQWQEKRGAGEKKPAAPASAT
ncbi:MAG: Spy/CpxP family protein refolding chaperone [Kiritimatiellaeota bacterium]|nr:Spy/CpxP family protein refolding chaperone [Kiritimatiellota bacterium]